MGGNTTRRRRMGVGLLVAIGSVGLLAIEPAHALRYRDATAPQSKPRKRRARHQRRVKETPSSHANYTPALLRRWRRRLASQERSARQRAIDRVAELCHGSGAGLEAVEALKYAPAAVVRQVLAFVDVGRVVAIKRFVTAPPELVRISGGPPARLYVERAGGLDPVGGTEVRFRWRAEALAPDSDAVQIARATLSFNPETTLRDAPQAPD